MRSINVRLGGKQDIGTCPRMLVSDAVDGAHPAASKCYSPEAQHLKSSAIHKNAGRLPYLLAQSGHCRRAETGII
jgi:hypothetical protein